MRNVTEAELRMALRLDGVTEGYADGFIHIVEQVQALKPGQELVKAQNLTEGHIGRMVDIPNVAHGRLTGAMTEKQKMNHEGMNTVIAVDGELVLLQHRTDVVLGDSSET